MKSFLASLLAAAAVAPLPATAQWWLLGHMGKNPDTVCVYSLNNEIGYGAMEVTETECAPLNTDAPADGYDRYKWTGSEDCTGHDNQSGCGNYITALQIFSDENCTQQVGEDHIEWWCDEPTPETHYWKLKSLI